MKLTGLLFWDSKTWCSAKKVPPAVAMCRKKMFNNICDFGAGRIAMKCNSIPCTLPHVLWSCRDIYLSKQAPKPSLTEKRDWVGLKLSTFRASVSYRRFCKREWIYVYKYMSNMRGNEWKIFKDSINTSFVKRKKSCYLVPGCISIPCFSVQGLSWKFSYILVATLQQTA